MNMHRGCEISEPPATALPLNFLCAEISEEFSRAMSLLKEVTDRTLFVWDSFSAPLPDSIVDTYGIAISKLFRPADFDECDTLSRDIEGNSVRLDSEQLHRLRQYGEFDVKSKNFPGERHTWKVTPYILKGSKNIVISFFEDFSFSLAQLVIYARDRLLGREPSVVQSLKMIWNSLYELLDLIFGLPHINHGDVDRKIHDERLRFITCELSVKSAKRKAVMDFWDAHEHLMCRKREVPKEAVEVKRPPYQFVTPARLTLDLRLHDTHLLQQCLKRIQSLKNHSAVGWFRDFKRNLVARLQEEGKTMEEVKEVVRHDALHHHAAKVFDAVRSFRDLEDIGHGLAEALIQQSSFNLIVREAKEAFAMALLQHQNEELNRMQTQHRWLYGIPEWRRRQLHRSTRDYLEMHKFDIHEGILGKCTLNGLEQYAFFVRRDLQFLKERERLLRQELVKSTSFADSQFIFTVSAQLIRHWRVYRRENPGSTAYAPVKRVLVKNGTRRGDADGTGIGDCSPRYVRDTSAQCMRLQKASSAQCARQGVVANQTTPSIDHEAQEAVGFDPLLAMHHVGRPGDRKCRNPEADLGVDLRLTRGIESGVSPSLLSTSQVSPLCDTIQPEYVVQSCFVYKSSTRHFMWRWLTFFVFTYSWLLRLEQLFLITIPFRTAFSLTAIFKPLPIYLKVTVDQSTGHLFYEKTSYQDTLISLLRRNWCQLRASRRKFDSAPAKGLLNKSAVSRPLHRVWCYLVRGLLASFLLLLLWPPVCLAVSTVSLLVGISLLLVLPAVFVGLHLLGLFVWDAYKPASKKNRWFPLPEVVFRRFLCGFLIQFTLSVLTACILCPLSMFFWLIWSVVRLACRSLWDAIIFNLIIRRSARVPAREDAMIKRVHGPGTSENHFYRAQPLDVLIVLLAQLELLELSLWRHQMDVIVNKPMVAYRRLVGSLSWLSVIPRAEGDIYNTLCTATQKCQLTVACQFDARVRQLRLDMKPDILARIKLSDWDLHVTLRVATRLADVFFHRRILPRVLLLNRSPDVWWSGLSLSPGDFFGLCTSLLRQTFGENLLTCIVETDTVFNFQAEDPQLFDRFHSHVKLLCMTESAPSQPPGRRLSAAGVAPTTLSKLPSSSTPSTCVLPTGKGTGDLTNAATSSDPGSLASDAVASTSEVASQVRSPGGVLPPDLAERNGVSDESAGELLALLDEIRLTESCRQSDATARRFDLIHVEPPTLDLGSFVPSSFIQLPSPLKSFPLHTGRGVDRCEACSPCLASSSFRGNKESLLSLVPSNRNQSSTLAQSEEAGLPLLLNGHQPFGRTYGAASADWLPSTPSDRHWCSLLFGDPRPGLPGASSLDCSSVYQVVEWVGCVYHPAVITLLMHARDREHRPLDLSHPALRFMVNLAISHHPKEPDEEGGRWRGGRRRRESCPRDHELVRSMASGLATGQASGQTRLGRTYSVAVPVEGQLSTGDLPSNVVRSLTTVDWRGNEVVASSRMLFPATSGHSLEARQSLFGGGSLMAFCQQDQQLLQTSCPEASGQPSTVADWRHTGDGHCRDTGGGSRQQLDYSTTTPTISLYGSEDDDDNGGISNEEADGTDYDALSISSVNQAAAFFIDGHLLASTPCTEAADAPLPVSDAPLARAIPPDDPLASQYTQPRLFPASERTACDGDREVRKGEPQSHGKEDHQPSTTEEEGSGQTTLGSHASVQPSPLRPTELPSSRSLSLEEAVDYNDCCAAGGDVRQTGKEPDRRRAARATSGSPAVGSRPDILAQTGSTTIGSSRTQ